MTEKGFFHKRAFRRVENQIRDMLDNPAQHNRGDAFHFLGQQQWEPDQNRERLLTKDKYLEEVLGAYLDQLKNSDMKELDAKIVSVKSGGYKLSIEAAYASRFFQHNGIALTIEGRGR